MFCIVSWHREARDLSFWDGAAWGVSEYAVFFQTRKEAAIALRKVKVVKGVPGEGFRKPGVLDVTAFNKKFGKWIEPKPRPKIHVTAHLDRKTGILERAAAHE